jgi:wobble nucleotide-excising tRNase
MIRMQEQIYKISIEGKCFTTNTILPLFKDKDSDKKPKPSRVSIIFGKNGSGKSTIAQAFSQYKLNEYEREIKVSLLNKDGNILKMTPEAKQHIFVFDETFIKNNVNIEGDGLNTIILLGKQGDIQKEIDTTKEQIKTLKATLNDLETELTEYNCETNSKSPDYYYKKIKGKLSEENGWAEKDAIIKKGGKAKQNSKITPKIIETIGDSEVNETLLELEEQFKNEYALFLQTNYANDIFEDEINQLSIPKGAEQKYLDLLAEKLQEPKLTEREQEIFKVMEKSSYITTASEYFNEENNDICPFCFRRVNEDYKKELLANINKILNKDVEKHQQQLKSAQLSTYDFDLDKFSPLDNQQAIAVDNAVQKYNDIVHRYNKQCEEKINNPYTPIKIEKLGLEDAAQKVNEAIEKLEQSRKAYNAAIQKREDLQKKLQELNIKIAHIQIENLYTCYKKQEEEKKIIEKKRNNVQDSLDETIKYLDKLNQRRRNVHIAAEKINQSLEYIFMSKNRLKLIPTANEYKLLVKGKPVKPEQVSCGERNIIALAYFFTQIFNNKEINSAYKEDLFLVIDDPISSFDMDNKIGIISYLQSQINNVLNGNSESKVLILSHDMETIYDFDKALKNIESRNNKSFIHNVWEMENCTLKQLNIEKRHEYSQLVKMVVKYAVTPLEELTTEQDMVIGNTMRRFLEAFATFKYRIKIEEMFYNDEIGETLDRKDKCFKSYFSSRMDRIILNNESHMSGRVRSLDDTNFFTHTSKREKQQTARDILCLVYLLDSLHLKSHIKKEFGSDLEDILNKIESWCDKISGNKLQDLNDKTA